MLPYTENVMDLFRAADFFLHPARTEPFGHVIIDSLLSGVPVISTEPCGNSMEVERYGADICLIEPFSQANLTQAISTMIERLPSYRAAAASASQSIRSPRNAWLEVIADHLEEAARQKTGNAAA